MSCDEPAGEGGGVPGREYQEQVLDASRCALPEAMAEIERLRRFETAMKRHLCHYDTQDWLHCAGGHVPNTADHEGKEVYCDVCDGDSGDVHPHGKRATLEAELAALREQLAERDRRIAELEAQLERLLHPGVSCDGPCKECGRHAAAWYIRNPIWNRFCPEGGILCMECFEKRAKAEGVQLAVWCNSEEVHELKEAMRRK